MKIAIHHSPESYSTEWIKYCKEKKINYKIVNCYDNDIMAQIEGCDAFLWHHNQVFPTDFLIAKQILYSLEMKGIVVYPDFRSGWHFDDKLGQKYLFEAMDIPHVKYHAFYSASTARKWLKSATFPVVSKLRGGAGSKNVRLIKSEHEALKIVNKAFGKGIRQYNPYEAISDTIKLMKINKATFKDLAKAAAHIVVPIKLENAKGREKGYVLFQDFVPNLNEDIRIQVLGDKCYGMMRKVRENDFRASGGGVIDFDGSKIAKDLIKLSFDISNKLKSQTVAFDFLLTEDGYKLIEVSYGWGVADGELEPGYWDKDLNWHSGRINPFGWIIEDVIKACKKK